MKPVRILLLLLLPLWLAACGHANHVGHIHFDGGEVAFDHQTVLIRTHHADGAQVGADGSLKIGGAPVKLTPAGQAALSRYNAAANGFIHQAVKLGVQAAHFALDSIGDMIIGMVNGEADKAGKHVEKGGHRIEQEAVDLCQGLKDWRTAQDAAVQAVPEFSPYAVIGNHDVEHDCKVEDHGAKGDEDDEDDEDKDDYKADPAKGQQPA
jgi:hypothetical protein